MEQISNLPLKYQGYAIVFQEVPDEVTLAFNISGCTHKCEQCHSKHLWEYSGNFLGEDFLKILSINKDFITCVCFMGGDQNLSELYSLCKQVKEYNLKTCIYSGSGDLNAFSNFFENDILDYLKLGRYDYTKGGLTNPNTNQKMYKYSPSGLRDITFMFQKQKL